MGMGGDESKPIPSNLLAQVVRKVDNAIHRINHYPVDKLSVNKANHAIRWIVIYPVDSASVIHLSNNWDLLCVGVQFFRDSMRALNDRMKIRENRWLRKVYGNWAGSVIGTNFLGCRSTGMRYQNKMLEHKLEYFVAIVALTGTLATLLIKLIRTLLRG